MRYPEAREGRMVVTRSGRQLLNSPARATYCEGDSVLVVVAVAPNWSAGLALRGRFPVDSVRAYGIGPALGGAGTAAAAFRAAADSVRPALPGRNGTVHLEAGRRASGRFEVGVADSSGGAEPPRLVGAFRALPTTDTSGACGATPRNQ